MHYEWSDRLHEQYFQDQHARSTVPWTERQWDSPHLIDDSLVSRSVSYPTQRDKSDLSGDFFKLPTWDKRYFLFAQDEFEPVVS